MLAHWHYTPCILHIECVAIWSKYKFTCIFEFGAIFIVHISIIIIIKLFRIHFVQFKNDQYSIQSKIINHRPPAQNSMYLVILVIGHSKCNLQKWYCNDSHFQFAFTSISKGHWFDVIHILCFIHYPHSSDNHSNSIKVWSALIRFDFVNI